MLNWQRSLAAAVPAARGDRWSKAAMLLIVLGLAGCSFEKPQAPKWDARFTIPLVNRHYTMQELIEDEPSLSADSAGLVHYSFDTTLDSFRVGDQLTFEEFSDFYSTSIGQMPVASPGGEGVLVGLTEIYPAAAALNGQSVLVPAFDFDMGKRTLPAYEEFEWISVASGSITLELQNNLVVPLGSPLRFALYDTRADTLIVSRDYNVEVAPGEVLKRTIDLTDRTFSNQISVAISGSSPGSGGSTVPIDTGSSFRVDVSISELQVHAARARIGHQQVNDRQDAVIDHGVMIRSAVIKQGTVRIQVSSHLPMPIEVAVVLPDFNVPSGGAVTETFALGSSGTSTRVLDFAGNGFAPESAQLGQQTVQLLWSVQTPGSGGYVTVQSSDDISVSFVIEGMIFSEINGSFQGKTVALEPSTYAVDVPEGIDSLNFDNVQLEMRLQNGIGFPAQTNLLLEGTNDDGHRVELRVQQAIQAGGPDGQPTETIIVLNRLNSSISQFLSALPTSIRVSGAVTIGGAGYEGRVRATDAVTGTVHIDAPLSFALPAQRVDLESDSLSIDEDARKQIRENLHDGSFAAQLLNHLPVGASVSMYFGSEKATLYTNPALVIGPIVAEMPSIEAGTGLVSEPRLSVVNLSLSEEQLKVFDRTPLFSGLVIEFPGTGGQLVRIIRSDYIDIKAVASVNVTVDPESTD